MKVHMCRCRLTKSLPGDPKSFEANVAPPPTALVNDERCGEMDVMATLSKGYDANKSESQP